MEIFLPCLAVQPAATMFNTRQTSAQQENPLVIKGIPRIYPWRMFMTSNL